MYPGLDPRGSLEMVLRRQEEIRAESQRETGVRRVSERVHGSRLAAFRLWRLHVVVWFEGAREAR